jgi:hypothetical protein
MLSGRSGLEKRVRELLKWNSGREIAAEDGYDRGRTIAEDRDERVGERMSETERTGGKKWRGGRFMQIRETERFEMLRIKGEMKSMGRK